MARRISPIVLQTGSDEDDLGQGLAGLGSLLQSFAGVKQKQQLFKQAEKQFGLTRPEAKSLGVDALKQIFLKEKLVNLERESATTEREEKATRLTDVLTTLGGQKLPKGVSTEEFGKIPELIRRPEEKATPADIRGATGQALAEGIKPAELAKFRGTETIFNSFGVNLTNVDKTFEIIIDDWKFKNPDVKLTPDITKKLREEAHQTVGGTTRVLGTDPETGNLLLLDSKTGNVIDMGISRPAPGRLQPLSSQATENVGVQNSVIDGITRAIDAVQTNPELLKKVGPIEGRWTNLKRIFVADPEAEGLKREIESMIRVAYAWSGKQISIQELDRLKDAILPSLSNPDANFMVSLRHAKNIMTTDRNAKLQAFKDANFDIGKLDKFLEGAPKLAPSKIKVILKTTGQTGTINADEFDENVYERINQEVR